MTAIAGNSVTVRAAILIDCTETGSITNKMIDLDAAYYGPCDSVNQNPLSNSCTVGSAGSSSQINGTNNAEVIWNYFISKGLTPVAVAGILGNFSQESTSALDPAIKQNNTTRAIPDSGDGKTGFGLAQWTSPDRQAALFAKIREAGLQKYYGEGWGNPDINSDKMPREDIDKLLLIELDFAWEGDNPKIKDIAEKLNQATSVNGGNGSAMIFHDGYERSGDNSEQLLERSKDAGKYLRLYGDGAGASGCAGRIGGVSTIEDAMPWAMKFISDTKEKYPDSSYAVAKLINTQVQANAKEVLIAEWPESSSFVCWGAYGCDECTTLSGWFVTAMTGYTYGGGNGGEVVANLKKKGVPTGDAPKPYSVFSTNAVGGSYGHTGVVLGVLEDGSVIALENNNGANLLKAYHYNIQEKYPDATYAYVGDKIKLN